MHIVVLAGPEMTAEFRQKFPEGKEFNIVEDAAAATYVFQNSTKP